MKIINELNIEESLVHFSDNLYVFKEKNEVKVFKKFFKTSNDYVDNQLNIVILINKMMKQFKRYIPNMVIPEAIVENETGIIGYVIPYISGVNLNDYLNDDKNLVEEKIFYLKEVGFILENLNKMRKDFKIDNLFINDIHEENFIVGKDKKLYLIDVDSFKILNSKPFNGKMLLAKNEMLDGNTLKYPLIETGYFSYYDANENTDIYCYLMMILNFLYKERIMHLLSKKQFYSYLQYLYSIGLEEKLLYAFLNIESDEVNINPVNELNSLKHIINESSNFSFENYVKTF